MIALTIQDNLYHAFLLRRWGKRKGKQMEKWKDLDGLIEALPGHWSKRYIYYLVQTKQIPHYKPSKRKLLFNLTDVEKWLRGTRVDPS